MAVFSTHDLPCSCQGRDQPLKDDLTWNGTNLSHNLLDRRHRLMSGQRLRALLGQKRQLMTGRERIVRLRDAMLVGLAEDNLRVLSQSVDRVLQLWSGEQHGENDFG